MFNVELAGVTVGIDNKYSFVERQCQKYLTEKNADFIVSVPDDVISMEKAQQPEKNFTDGYCESICLYRALCERMVDYDAFLFHASVVAVDGKAYAFAAKSGTGKSTHTRLWLEHFGENAMIVNGDKPIIRHEENAFVAYGTPWCGKEALESNVGVALKALCFIERGTENRIEKADSKEVCRRIFHQVVMPKEVDKRMKFLNMIENMVKTVPVYILYCNISDEAVVVAYNEMSK